MKLEDKIDFIIKMMVFVGIINFVFTALMFMKTLELLEFLVGSK